MEIVRIPSRHGDLILRPIDKMPPTARYSGDLVLQRGETTGHAHKLQGSVQVFEDNEVKYFEASATTQLIHEEHHMIDLPAGVYRLEHEREFDPFSELAERTVRD